MKDVQEPPPAPPPPDMSGAIDLTAWFFKQVRNPARRVYKVYFESQLVVPILVVQLGNLGPKGNMPYMAGDLFSLTVGDRTTDHTILRVSEYWDFTAVILRERPFPAEGVIDAEYRVIPLQSEQKALVKREDGT